MTSDFIRVLFQLKIKHRLIKDFAIGSPHIAPSGFLCFHCPLHKIKIILGSGIGVAGDIDCHSTDISHDLSEIFGGKLRAECGVYLCDELLVCLFFSKAPDQF